MPWLKRDEDEVNLGQTALAFGYDLLEYEFHLTVEGKLSGIFQRLTGGEIEIACLTHDIVFETGASTTLKIPGATTFHPFTLERGFALYYELYNWLMEASNGHIINARRNGSIEMKKHGDTLLRWNFEGAWPTKLSGFNFNQYTGAQVARVSLTMEAETVTLEQL